MSVRERFGLQLLKLLLGNCAAVEQVLRGCDLFSRIATTGNSLDVLVGFDLRLSHLSHLPLGHSAATRDQVNESREEGKDDQEDNPDCLTPPAQIPISEQISDDVEQHHQVEHEEKRPDQKPEKIPKTIHCARPSAESMEALHRASRKSL